VRKKLKYVDEDWTPRYTCTNIEVIAIMVNV